MSEVPLLIRLRTWEIPPHKDWPTHRRNPDGEEAADLIETQTTRIAELEAEVERLRGQVESWTDANRDGFYA